MLNDPRRTKMATMTKRYKTTASAHGHTASILYYSILLFSLTLPLSLFSDSQLSEKSPFLPPGHGVKVKPVEQPTVQPQGPISREIEFRGLIQIGGTYQFSIFNKREQKGYWLKENVAQEGISVRGYDANSSTVIVNMNGRSERLTLMAATDNPLPVAKAQTPPPSNVNQPTLPPQITNQNKQGNARRVIPRRRVILPNQN